MNSGPIVIGVAVLTNRGIIDQRIGNQAFVCRFFDHLIRMASMTFSAAYLCFIQAIPIATVVKVILVFVTADARGVFWRYIFLGKRQASLPRD